MKSFICIDKCTFGKPPRMYSPGDILLLDSEKAPKHFKEGGAVAKAAPAASGDEGKTLADAAPGEAAAKADILAAKTAPEPCTVGELAEKLGVDAKVIKEAAGKSKVTQKLTSDEVSAVMSSVAKAAPAASGDAAPATEE